MRLLTSAGVIALVLIPTACERTPVTAPEANAPRAPALATQSHSPLSETTYSGGLVAFDVVSQTELPSGTTTREVATIWDIQGDWEGTWSAENHQTLHKNGVLTEQAILHFQGTVLEDFEGTLDLRFQGSSKPGEYLTGHFTILRGTGELANLRGQGTLRVLGFDQYGQLRIEGTVDVHFAP